MTIAAELLEEMETVSKRFRLSTDQLAELEADSKAEEITVTWQRITGRPRASWSPPRSARTAGPCPSRTGQAG